MPGRPGAIRENRVEGKADAVASDPTRSVVRPRNPEVEQAWKDYAQAYEAWQKIINPSTYSSMGGFASAEDARMIELQSKAREKDEALFAYFEVYDRDQHGHE